MKVKESLIFLMGVFFNDLTLGFDENIAKRTNSCEASTPKAELCPTVGVRDMLETFKLTTEEIVYQRATRACASMKTTKCRPSKPAKTPRKSTQQCLSTRRECKLVRATRARSKHKKIGGNLGNCDEDQSPCHPAGGVPKNVNRVPVLRSDPNFDKVLTGELTERIVTAIIKKSSKNDKIRNSLGLCYFDLDQLGDELINQPLETEGCCTKLKGELRCFLMWILEQEPTRRRRETSPFEDNCSSNVSLALPSSFYGLIPPPLNKFN